MPTIQYRNKLGERIPGVTTVLSLNLGWNKQALMYWANQEGLAGRSHRDTAQKAADAGTCGHELIDCHIKGTQINLSKYLPEILEKGQQCFENFLEWQKMVDFRPSHTEIHLVSEIYGYGATPDCIGTVIEKRSIIDWKTGNGVYPEMLAQLAAYRQAYDENYPEQRIEGGYHLLRIGKEDASFHHHYWKDLLIPWEVFKHCLHLHYLQKQMKKIV